MAPPMQSEIESNEKSLKVKKSKKVKQGIEAAEDGVAVAGAEKKKRSKKVKEQQDDTETAADVPSTETKQKKSKKVKDDASSADENDKTEDGSSKKRKREILPEEIEIDVNLPEPASKKALRKAKKAKTKPETAATDGAPTTETTDAVSGEGKRSEYGVWIGNLPWSATKATLREFLVEHSEIKDSQITRVHMPPPAKSAVFREGFKPFNKGFAYVDFSTELAMYAAIALTETKFNGRAVLIKNAKSFDGRPKKVAGEEDGKPGHNAVATKGGHPPNKRVFVGNLAFDVTKEDLEEHFGQCGEILHIHMATFEDTGKCKGYAWITFDGVEAATSAVNGFIYKQEKNTSDAESDEEKTVEAKPTKPKKGRKWYINKLRGRDLRCEFAEDSTIRYNKRYGAKDKKQDGNEDAGDAGDAAPRFKRDAGPREKPREKPRERRKVDPRSIRPGAAHTFAPRASQAIVASTGTKTTFD